MKTILKISLALATMVGITSCHRREGSRHDVVYETYVHRYGVEVPQDNWTSSGKHGQVISTLKNGVVVCKSYNSGILEGNTTYSYPHSETIEKVQEYIQGILTKETCHYFSGAPKQEILIKGANKRSITHWYENGIPQSQEDYENGLLIKGNYFNPHHQLESEVVNRDGTRIIRDNYGIILSTDTIKNGEMVLRTTYHPNGNPRALTPYVNGVIEGQRKTFLPGGEPNSSETWLNGIQEGITVVFQNGEKHAEVPYVRGDINGVERRYRDGTNVIQEITWMDNMRHGPTTTYVGNTANTEWFFQDRKMSKSQYDIQTRHRR